MQKVCGRYLQQQLDASNCLGICEFGEQQGLLGVAAKAWAFLRENFEAVAREDEFLQLSQERLAACLASDLLQVQPEQSRLEALLRWVRHDPQVRAAHLPELLGLVHLDAVPRLHVQQLLASEPLIRESEACREALAQGHEGVSDRWGAGSGAPKPHPHGDRRDEVGNPASLGSVHFPSTYCAPCVCHFLPVRTGDPEVVIPSPQLGGKTSWKHTQGT